MFRFLFFGGKIMTPVIDPPSPKRNFEEIGMRMEIHWECQTWNDFLTIRECQIPNAYANDHRWF